MELSHRAKCEKICLNCKHFSANIDESKILNLETISVLHDCNKENNIQLVEKYDDYNKIIFTEKKLFTKVLRSTTCNHFENKNLLNNANLTTLVDNEED